MVNQLLLNDGTTWNSDLITQLFDREVVEAILQIRTLNPNVDDCWMWAGNKKGLFSVSSTYTNLIQGKLNQMDQPEGNNSRAKACMADHHVGHDHLDGRDSDCGGLAVGFLPETDHATFRESKNPFAEEARVVWDFRQACGVRRGC
ncbi:ribonuclease H-like superfamily protein [Striga asiatica]|uniref:Ribonuclease H-like superfamily protein n=1 Tax=Striga asiatica TaxID=4170 RepID=A0A5A7Q615_STRAF|nr:ribonuclease H-like superfamily protein [Striga asiatica]